MFLPSDDTISQTLVIGMIPPSVRKIIGKCTGKTVDVIYYSVSEDILREEMQYFRVDRQQGSAKWIRFVICLELLE